MKDVIDFERLCQEAVAFASPRLCDLARRLHAPVIRDAYVELERLYDSHDRVWATRVGVPFHGDVWDNRRL